MINDARYEGASGAKNQLWFPIQMCWEEFNIYISSQDHICQKNQRIFREIRRYVYDTEAVLRNLVGKM